MARGFAWAPPPLHAVRGAGLHALILAVAGVADGVAADSPPQCGQDAEIRGACGPADLRDRIFPGTRCFAYDLPDFKFPLRGPKAKAQWRDTDHRDAVDLMPQDFREAYVAQNKPVVISGAASSLFHDVGPDWTFEGIMRSAHAGVKLPVKKQHVRLVGPVDATLNVSEIYREPDRTVLFQAIGFPLLRSSEEFFRHGKGRRRGDPFNLGLHKEYAAKLKFPNFLHATEPTQLKGSFNLHLSNQGGAIPHSHVTTLNILFEGAKRWLLVNPLHYPNSTVRETFEQIDKMSEQRASVDGTRETSQEWFRSDAEPLLEALGIPYHEFIQNEGEAVFIPSFYTHATMDLCRTTVGVELMGDLLTNGFKPAAFAHFKESGTVEL